MCIRDSSRSGGLFILGAKNGQAICASINESNTIQEEFRIPSIAKPRAMAIQRNKIWICGENPGQNSFVKIINAEKGKGVFPLGPGIFVSAMETAGENVYLTEEKLRTEIQKKWKTSSFSL